MQYNYFRFYIQKAIMLFSPILLALWYSGKGLYKRQEMGASQKSPRDCFVNEKGLMLGIRPYGFFFLVLTNDLWLSMDNLFTSFYLSMEMIIPVFITEILYA